MNIANARMAILQTDLVMRSHYKALKDQVQSQLDPFIVVANGPEGGTYWLIESGRVIETSTPIDVIFQIAKS